MTHRGRIRANNEDTFLAMTLDGQDVRYLGKEGQFKEAGPDFIFAVSDGMGGERAGEFASRVTVSQLTKLLPKSFRIGAMGISGSHIDLLGELFSTIHKELIDLGRHYHECEGMGATLSLCWFTPEWMYFSHIGDSRIYYLPAQGKITQISHDHSYVGWLRRKGELNEREARTHPRKNALQQALGAENQFVDPQIGSVGFSPGDQFLICSDGLIDGLWDKNLEELIRFPTPTQATVSPAPRLIEAALEVSGRDNLTAIVIEVLAPPPTEPTSST